VAQRCQRSIAESAIATTSGPLSVTASAGVAAVGDRHTDAALLINEAYAALPARAPNGAAGSSGVG
jgi:hypothetical protein